MKIPKSVLWGVLLSNAMFFGSSFLAAAANNDLSLFFDDSEMVEVESRYPKPLSQVTEQVSIYTAEDIERSHAHTIGQFLSEVPGLFINFFSADLGQSNAFNALGTRPYHTLVLIDGVRQNIGSNGRALIEGIAPSIVKKIEIIKGPASSVWGSSLGGVINIITKDSGETKVPSGSVSATYGEGPSHGINGEIKGKLANLGYYFNVDQLDSEGLYKDRYTRKESFYGKLKLSLANDMKIGLTYSDSKPRYKVLDCSTCGTPFNEYISNDTRFGSLSIDIPFKSAFHLNATLKRFMMDYSQEKDYYISAADYYDQMWSEAATETSIRLSWKGKKHTAVLGTETRRAKMDYSWDWWPNPAFSGANPTAREEHRGVYTNASLNFGDLTISPGIRHDHTSNSGEAVSPSLGAVYRLFEHTNLRATIARGFSAPYLSRIVSNPQLNQEVIWNYQAGIETTYFKYFSLTATAFQHRIKDAWKDNGSTNNGKARRWGSELEIETLPWHKFTLKAATAASSEDGVDYENKENYAANLSLLYDNPKLCRAKLNGRYVWWNDFISNINPKHDDFIWDIVVDKEIINTKNYRARAFASVHNLFNSTQSWDDEYETPQRWVEGGVTIKF